MAASGWHIVIPYADDPNVVLETAHRRAFADRQYSVPAIEPEFLDEIDFFTVDEETRSEIIAEYGIEPLVGPIREVGIDGLIGWLESKAASSELATLDELRALQCVSSSGTHCVLDIRQVAPARQDGAIYPLSESQLLRLFGTAQPPEPIDRVAGLDDSLYSRNQGIYFTIYENGKPTGVYIEGASGD